MRIPVAALLVCAGAVSVFASPLRAGEPSPLALDRMGYRQYLKPGAEPRSVDTFMLTLGDTRREDFKLSQRDPKMTPFILDAAQYGRAADGTWMVHRFRMPSFSGMADDDSQAFLDFLKRKDVRAALEDVYARKDFGKPGDFLYRKMGLRQSDLPAPFNRLSPDALSQIQTIFVYNADGTMHIKITPPADEAEPARAVFERLNSEIAKP